ncbi:6911_t:CDS:1 [Racocetra fulgida]|uniref:6911_t:CDS:1 n=1 Tax=Racocetra fulgida TaxID=60492 RepID=A0A9N9G467_9GLOM|nr:6911_t:CDS:1 [Racocetra fulgida]
MFDYSYVLDISNQLGQKKVRIDLYILNLLSKNCFNIVNTETIYSRFPFYSIVKITYQGFSYNLIIWNHATFNDKDVHTINDMLLSYEKDTIVFVCDANIENIVNKKFENFETNFAANNTSFCWTKNENTIIDFLKEKFYYYYIWSKNLLKDDNSKQESFVRFMKEKNRDITFIHNYYQMWLQQ